MAVPVFRRSVYVNTEGLTTTTATVTRTSEKI